LFESADYFLLTDVVLRQYAGNEIVDDIYIKAQDGWEFVKPYAIIAQERGTELYVKAKEGTLYSFYTGSYILGGSFALHELI
jgi:hypothetical protein